MGTIVVDAGGSRLLVAQGIVFQTLPEQIQVTIEPVGGSASPTGRTMIFHQAGR